MVRVIHLTKSRWPNEYDQDMTMTNLIFWIWPKLKPTNLIKPKNLNFASGVLLTFMHDVFFFLLRSEETGLARLGRCPSQCKLARPVQADCTSICFGVKLMLVSVMNFGQIKKIRFVVVKIFRSYSNQFLVILIRSSYGKYITANNGILIFLFVTNM